MQRIERKSYIHVLYHFVHSAFRRNNRVKLIVLEIFMFGYFTLTLFSSFNCCRCRSKRLVHTICVFFCSFSLSHVLQRANWALTLKVNFNYTYESYGLPESNINNLKTTERKYTSVLEFTFRLAYLASNKWNVSLTYFHIISIWYSFF